MATEKISIGQHVQTAASAFAAVSAIVGCVAYFAQIGPHITTLETSVDKVNARVDNQTTRVDQIEASRTIGLQRLATAEEAVKGVKEYLAKIDAKVDRLLMRGR